MQHLSEPLASQFTTIDGKSQSGVASFMKYASRMGWEITATDDFGVHLRRRKRYSPSIAVVAALTAVFLVGFIVWLVGLAVYLCSKHEFLFVPYSDLTPDSALSVADLLL